VVWFVLGRHAGLQASRARKTTAGTSEATCLIAGSKVRFFSLIGGVYRKIHLKGHKGKLSLLDVMQPDNLIRRWKNDRQTIILQLKALDKTNRSPLKHLVQTQWVYQMACALISLYISAFLE
jgi:hypothetical protein